MHLNRYRIVSQPYAEHIFIFISLVITTIFGFSGIVYGLSKPVNEYMGYGNVTGCADPTKADCQGLYDVSHQRCYGYYGCFFVSLYFNMGFYLLLIIGVIIYLRYKKPETEPILEYNSSGEFK